MTGPADDALAQALAALAPALRGRPWPPLLPGFRPLAPPRAMRAVLGGALPGPSGTVEVALKVHRALSWTDRLARRLRGGRGAREARVLTALRAAGLPAAEPLGVLERGADVLATRWLPDLAPLPPAREAPRALVERVAALLAGLFRAGLVHRDLTAANVPLQGGAPLLLDAGGARLAGPPRRPRVARRRAAEHLAQAAHGFLHGAGPRVRLRALRAWLASTGLPGPWRDWLPDLERALRRRERRHRRRRERRTLRSGRHFALVHGPGGLGVRRREVADDLVARATTWIAAAPPGAVPLPSSARVHRVRPPDGGREVVLKRYAPVAPGRAPRAVRAFARAVALEERGLAVPRALLALGGHAGSVLVSEAVEAPTLHDAVAALGPSPGARAGRRALCAALGRFLGALHAAEVSHRDLKPQNLLVRPEPGGPALCVADLDGARPRYAPLPRRRRARDLGRLAASLHLPRTDRLRVLRAYRAAAPHLDEGLRPLAHAVHREAQAQRRRLARRYGGAAPPGPAAPGGPPAQHR